MNNFKSLFWFHKRQQRGIFVLIIILLVLAIVRFAMSLRDPQPLELKDTSAFQLKIDSLKAITAHRKDTIYPFNPNYITDYRGYILGLKEAELERLMRFRESGKFINNPTQFQEVTQVSDRWLDSIAPYFKFPAWVNQPKNNYQQKSYSDRVIVAKDINSASLQELQKVYGIGPAISNRIVQEREKLQGFVDIAQVQSIYGLTDSTMTELKKHFYVTPRSGFKKLALNQASRDELSTIPYFNDYLVDKLVEQRTLRDGFKSWKEVAMTSRFPEEKLPLIQLYLTLD